MADSKQSKKSDDATSAKSSSEAETTQSKRRILRQAAEPASFRERSEKAQADSTKPRKGSRAAGKLTAPFRAIGRAIAKVLKPLGKFRAVRAIGYILAPPYIRNSWKELKQVTWPTRTQTRRLTFAVVLFSLVFGGLVAAVDFGLDKLFRAFILNQ